jgi:hypothetical protein
MVTIAAISLKTAPFRLHGLGGTALSSRVGRGTIMTAPSKAALRAELEATLANYRGPVKQCPTAPPPVEELETLDDEDEAGEQIVPGLR